MNFVEMFLKASFLFFQNSNLDQGCHFKDAQAVEEKLSQTCGDHFWQHKIPGIWSKFSKSNKRQRLTIRKHFFFALSKSMKPSQASEWLALSLTLKVLLDRRWCKRSMRCCRLQWYLYAAPGLQWFLLLQFRKVTNLFSTEVTNWDSEYTSSRFCFRSRFCLLKTDAFSLNFLIFPVHLDWETCERLESDEAPGLWTRDLQRRWKSRRVLKRRSVAEVSQNELLKMFFFLFSVSEA